MTDRAKGEGEISCALCEGVADIVARGADFSLAVAVRRAGWVPGALSPHASYTGKRGRVLWVCPDCSKIEGITDINEDLIKGAEQYNSEATE